MYFLKFVKMQGIGNDFIVIQGEVPMNADLAKRICDRRFGVGADQILWIKPARDRSKADLRMEILNADGSEAEMCGNGIRAVALYVDKRAREKKPQYRIETLGGVKTVSVKAGNVLVDMGAPKLGEGFPKGETLEVGGKKLKFFEVNMGNPHAVFFDADHPSESLDINSLGPLIENHPRFPERTNVEFVSVESPSAIRVRVWERGAGITLACGTGACASAVATLATERASGTLKVQLPGGDLSIGWAGIESSVMMEGPAREVFTGEYEL